MDGLKPGDPTNLGTYRVLGRLGSGPSSTVYFAGAGDGSDSGGSRFAIKVLGPKFADDERVRSRLMRESERIRSVAGRHVARVHDVGVDGRSVFLVNEFVEGSTLESLVANGRRIQGPLLWFIAEGLVDGLRAIHAAGIVHGDLKPANVFIGPAGVKVADFALGALVDEGGSARPGTGIGSWMSPEQLAGGPVDARCDIFTMGLILASLALGRHPYSTGTGVAQIDIADRIATGAPAIDAIQSPMRDVLARCLSTDPAQRPLLVELGSFFASAGTNPSTQPIPVVQVPDSNMPDTDMSEEDMDRSPAAASPHAPVGDPDASRFADTPPSLERVDVAPADPSRAGNARAENIGGISESGSYVIQDGSMIRQDGADSDGVGQAGVDWDGRSFDGESSDRRRRTGRVVAAAAGAILALVAAAGIIDAVNVVDLGLIGAADVATTTTTTSTTSTTTTVVATTTIPPVPVYRIYEVEGNKYRWNPCQNPIKILLNPEDELTPGQQGALESFLTAQAAELSTLTGMRIEYSGLTEEVSGRGYTFGEEILLHIDIPGEGILEDDKPFEGAISSDRVKDGFREIDAVNFHYNANALQYLFLEDELHTYGQWLVMLMLGNALGLNLLSEADMNAAGSTDPEGWENEIMFYGGKHLDTPVWGPGDRQGLIEVGAGAGCF